jgi:transposase-like protein
VTAEKPDHPIIHMKCRRGSDLVTHGQSCNGMQAYKLTPDGSQHVQFRCTLCNYSWTVPIGGSFST